MRTISLLIAVVISLSILAPQGIAYIPGGTGEPAIATLDLCNQAIACGAELFSFLCEQPLAPVSLESAGAHETIDAVYPPLIIPSRPDRPPEAFSPAA